MPNLILKLGTLYGAYAPEFNVSAYGTCRDEAINNLAEEIIQRQPACTPTKTNQN